MEPVRVNEGFLATLPEYVQEAYREAAGMSLEQRRRDVGAALVSGGGMYRGKSRGESYDGMNYLSLIASAFDDAVREVCGSCPTLQALLRLPACCFDSTAVTQSLCVVDRGVLRIVDDDGDFSFVDVIGKLSRDDLPSWAVSVVDRCADVVDCHGVSLSMKVGGRCVEVEVPVSRVQAIGVVGRDQKHSVLADDTSVGKVRDEVVKISVDEVSYLNCFHPSVRVQVQERLKVDPSLIDFSVEFLQQYQEGRVVPGWEVVFSVSGMAFQQRAGFSSLGLLQALFGELASGRGNCRIMHGGMFVSGIDGIDGFPFSDSVSPTVARHCVESGQRVAIQETVTCGVFLPNLVPASVESVRAFGYRDRDGRALSCGGHVPDRVEHETVPADGVSRGLSLTERLVSRVLRWKENPYYPIVFNDVCCIRMDGSKNFHMELSYVLSFGDGVYREVPVGVPLVLGNHTSVRGITRGSEGSFLLERFLRLYFPVEYGPNFLREIELIGLDEYGRYMVGKLTCVSL